MKVSVELPDTAGFAATEPELVREALVATLYHLGKISGKEGAEALGLSRRAFEELLPRFGFSSLADDEKNLEIELSA